MLLRRARFPSGSTLHVSQAFDDPAVPHAHDVDASDPIRLQLAPAEPPADDPALPARPDLFHFEDVAGRGRDTFPEIEAGLASFVTRAVRSRPCVLENA